MDGIESHAIAFFSFSFIKSKIFKIKVAKDY